MLQFQVHIMFQVSLSLCLIFASTHQSAGDMNSSAIYLHHKPYFSSAAEQQRCLLKEGMQAKFSDDMRIEILRKTTSANECADACYNHQTCDSFQYNDYDYQCVLLKGAYPNPNSMSSNNTSGWCPKGDRNHTEH